MNNYGHKQTEETKKKLSLIFKGKHQSPRTEFKKGMIGIWRGKRNLKICGKKNYLWKGEKVSYSGLHHWLVRWLGEPKECVYCGEDEGRLEWANIFHTNTRKFEDYISLCVSCHRRYDHPKYR